MNSDELNQLSKRINQANAKWWQDPATGQPIKRDTPTLLALVISELAEALEGIRKDRKDDHLPHRKMEEVEMADTVIRLLDLAGGLNLEIYDVECSLIWIGSVYSRPKSALVFYLMREVSNLDCVRCNLGISRVIVQIDYYCQRYGYDLWATVEEKLAYNVQRADHKPENRVKEGGKKF